MRSRMPFATVGSKSSHFTVALRNPRVLPVKVFLTQKTTRTVGSSSLWARISLHFGMMTYYSKLWNQPELLWKNSLDCELMDGDSNLIQYLIIQRSFLDHAIRVTRENYKPRPGVCLRLSQYLKFVCWLPSTSDDVLRARVTTIGPEEHTIAAEGFNGSGKQWTIYDVGGSRNQRGIATLSSADISSYSPHTGSCLGPVFWRWSVTYLACLAIMANRVFIQSTPSSF